MQRAIVGFSQDTADDWVADLDCGHCQRVRDACVDSDWVTTALGRQEQLGVLFDCPRCDRFELPAHFAPYKQTPVFTAATVPAGLRRDHSTRRGVWARIVVLEGTLRYTVDALKTHFNLSSTVSGVVIPEVLHRVDPQGAVRFYVEFYAAPSRAT